MDELIKKLSGLGLSGVILVIAIAAAGGNSAAVIAFLGALGGPLGIVGGLGLLSLVGMVGEAIGQFGLETLIQTIYAERGKSESLQMLLKEIKQLPISDQLKEKLKKYLDPENKGESQAPKEPRVVEIVEE
ncbi:MAG: hypothetical protein QNJ37_19480 [Crocosphaera sp.]|nr:hypothetical protein [Crocosphaera sp.]